MLIEGPCTDNDSVPVVQQEFLRIFGAIFVTRSMDKSKDVWFSEFKGKLVGGWTNGSFPQIGVIFLKNETTT